MLFEGSKLQRFYLLYKLLIRLKLLLLSRLFTIYWYLNLLQSCIKVVLQLPHLMIEHSIKHFFSELDPIC